MTATISLPEGLRDRLRTYGHAGMTYSDILQALMDRVEREDFVREMRAQFAATARRDYVDLEDL